MNAIIQHDVNLAMATSFKPNWLEASLDQLFPGDVIRWWEDAWGEYEVNLPIGTKSKPIGMRSVTAIVIRETDTQHVVDVIHSDGVDPRPVGETRVKKSKLHRYGCIRQAWPDESQRPGFVPELRSRRLAGRYRLRWRLQLHKSRGVSPYQSVPRDPGNSDWSLRTVEMSTTDAPPVIN